MIRALSGCSRLVAIFRKDAFDSGGIGSVHGTDDFFELIVEGFNAGAVWQNFTDLNRVSKLDRERRLSRR